MPRDDGWICLYRKFLKHWSWSDSQTIALLIWCLLKASYRDEDVLYRGDLYRLKRGQLVAGIPQIVAGTGLSRKVIERRLRMLSGGADAAKLRDVPSVTQVREPEISLMSIVSAEGQTKTRKRYNVGWVITVINYERYQDKPKREGISREHRGNIEGTSREHLISPPEAKRPAKLRDVPSVTESQNVTDFPLTNKQGNKRTNKNKSEDRRRRWSEDEIRRILSVANAQEALSYFVEWGWIALGEARKRGRAVPLESKGSGVVAVKAAGRLLSRWGPGHFIRIVRAYYETEFTEFELRKRDGFPSISHLEATDNIVNESTGPRFDPPTAILEVNRLQPRPEGAPRLKMIDEKEGGKN